MHTTRFVLVGALSTIGALAQVTNAPAAAAKFHLPVGTHSVPQLIELVAQAVRRPIHGTIDAVRDAEPLQLQTELVLGAGDWEDGVAALLSARGLVLTFDPDQRRYEVLATPTGNVDWMVPRAVALDLQQFAARPAMFGPVRVLVPTKVPLAHFTNTLRPYLAPKKTPFVVDPDAEGRGFHFTAMAPTVRLALNLFGNVDSELATAWTVAAPPPWPRPATKGHRLAAGDHTVASLIDGLATSLRRNIVTTVAIRELDHKINLAAAFEGDEWAFEAKVTSLLWEAKVLILDLVPQNSVYEAVLYTDMRSMPSERASPRSRDEILARPDWMGLATVTILMPIDEQSKAMDRIRPLFGAGQGPSMTVGTARGGMRFLGLSTAMGAMLRAASEPAPASANGK